MEAADLQTSLCPLFGSFMKDRKNRRASEDRQQLRLFMQHVKTSLFLLRNLTNPEYTKAGCRETATVWPREHAG